MQKIVLMIVGSFIAGLLGLEFFAGVAGWILQMTLLAIFTLIVSFPYTFWFILIGLFAVAISKDDDKPTQSQSR